MASAAKICKLDQDNNDESQVNPGKLNSILNEKDFKDLSKFRLDKILNNNSSRKVVSLKGNFEGSSGDAVVILEKTTFSEDTLRSESDYFNEKSYLQKVFHNDIYGNYHFFPKIELNAVKATVIHPATQKHIDKYSVHNLHIVNETPKLYEDIVLPHLIKDQFDLQWVYNILDHTSESDRIVYEDLDPDSGFILLPDLKWNGEIESLYLLALCNKKDIKSLRDLKKHHLPLLKNILKKGVEVISSKYGLNSSQLRIYVHYQPSFYHFHVHFTYIRYDAPGILAERAHILSNIISNIELLPNYYQEVTIPFVIRENDGLFKALEEGKILNKL
ncbi:hypothetical protein WA026_013830 [Henosepilachna vigintioctopunctata]|uniref:m7GpppX diphosphatase n=1 Tax=Henosepilachna vigintioctopunctata TaxID=420089 RepID=A0AAW1UYJ5_9CUCU